MCPSPGSQMLQEKLQGTMNVGAMTHKRLNAVYIASPTRKSIARAGLILSHISHCTEQNSCQMPGVCVGGGGGGWATLELTGTTLVHTRFDLTVAKLTLSLAFRPRPGKPCHCNFATVKFRK